MLFQKLPKMTAPMYKSFVFSNEFLAQGLHLCVNIKICTDGND